MSEEEKKEDLKAVYTGALEAGELGIANMIKGRIDVIEKQQKEIDKKDKIINEMGEHIEKGCDFDSTIQTKQEVIDYFTKKVSEEE